MQEQQRIGNHGAVDALQHPLLNRIMGEGERSGNARAARAGAGRILFFALLWMLPLSALIGFAAFDALRQGASSTFRYVGF